jgi:hypothetical protein
MFFALRVIALGMMFGRRAMRFGGILVMFSCFVVLVFSHWISPVNICVIGWQLGDASIGSAKAVSPASEKPNAARRVLDRLLFENGGYVDRPFCRGSHEPCFRP